jgi:hypothetical protein
MWCLWSAKESKDEKFSQDYKKWRNSTQYFKAYNSRAKYIDGKYYILAFNYETALLEKREVDSINHKHLLPKVEKVKDLIEGKPLPPPVSERAVPSKVKMTAKGRDKWIEKCPDYMKAWAIKFLKPKDESW